VEFQLKKSFIIILLLSLGVTISSPYIFSAYVHEKPMNLERPVYFGGPFPFFEQEIEYPLAESDYPLDIPFTSYFDENLQFKLGSFFFSFISYFLLFYSIYAIIMHYTNRRQERVSEEMERRREDMAIARNKGLSPFSKE